MPPKIELKNLTKKYGEILAVDDVNASFEEGSYTMILGPSGSGKSTLLRLIAGLENPTSGEVLIDGKRVTNVPPQDRELSMVFQNLALWDHKTVRKNMAFGLKMEGAPAAERQKRVEETASLLQIQDKLDERPQALSGGQQQRVALGRSLVRHPDVILLDEPLASLDERLRLEMRTELKRIQRETGTTFIHVTHNQEDSMTVADDILLIHKGKMQQFGSPMNLYDSPANEFVADFIGSPSMNLVSATFEGQDRLIVDGREISLPDDGLHLIDDHSDGSVRLGIRPEAISLLNGDNGDISVTATVSLVETFGDYNWYYLNWGADSELVVQSADDVVMDTVEEGDEVDVFIPPDGLHLFDPKTGEALN